MKSNIYLIYFIIKIKKVLFYSFSKIKTKQKKSKFLQKFLRKICKTITLIFQDIFPPSFSFGLGCSEKSCLQNLWTVFMDLIRLKFAQTPNNQCHNFYISLCYYVAIVSIYVSLCYYAKCLINWIILTQVSM